MKFFYGIVIGKTNNTAIVEKTRLVKHSKYKKILTIKSKYVVDDKNNETKKGDKVVFIETRPISKTKHFKILKIINKKV